MPLPHPIPDDLAELVASFAAHEGTELIAVYAITTGAAATDAVLAGVPGGGTFADLTYQQIEAIIQVNVLGVMYGTRAFLPGMLKRGHGHIVNVASLAGRFATPGAAVYGASRSSPRSRVCAPATGNCLKPGRTHLVPSPCCRRRDKYSSQGMRPLVSSTKSTPLNQLAQSRRFPALSQYLPSEYRTTELESGRQTMEGLSPS